MYFILCIYLLFSFQGEKLSDSICDSVNYWEDYTVAERDSVLSSKELDKSIRELYFETRSLTDDNESIDVLNELISLTSPFKALYFYVFNSVCYKADGAVAEIIGEFCLKILICDSQYVFKYLCDHRDLFEKYARDIGCEFYFSEEGTSDLNHDINSLSILLKTEMDSSNMEEKINEFITLIEFYKNSID